MKKKYNKVLYWLLALASLVAIARTSHYYITEYVDNSVNDYAIVKVQPETPKTE